MEEGKRWGNRELDGGWQSRNSNSNYGRPPNPTGSWVSWQSTVPSWERRFCTEVCLVPWNKICASKSTMSMYKNVIQWDDSAAADAFQDAKERYWAAINGLPCNLPLPDPDMYIEKVNYNAVIDPQLVADLDKIPPPHDRSNDANDGWDSFLFADKPVPVSGWGDEEDPSPQHDNKAECCSMNWDLYIEKPVTATGWGNAEAFVPTNGDLKDTWNCSGGWGDGNVQDSSWGGGGNIRWEDGRDKSWRQRDNWNNERGRGGGGNNLWDDGRDNSWGQRDNWNSERGRGNGRKRNGGQFGPRFTKSRYRTDEYQVNNSWKNGRDSTKAEYPNVKTMHSRQPLPTQQWKSRHSCGPMNHQRSTDSGGAWNWEKPIS